ncbi:cellulase [Pseudidiomarina aestuarii]|uniref:cellulase n=1 Tax=Pseudidiomarina aestuarii TaxID=624146 RepID=A0A2T4CX59_9GAMM|nr:cellulase [Pseudidiomarina aestuarii]PTB90393.1 cellulase [Pseudidiomarina aestuarii]PTB90472.1 cellulase [Pseudidiomarina aestuarii]
MKKLLAVMFKSTLCVFFGLSISACEHQQEVERPPTELQFGWHYQRMVNNLFAGNGRIIDRSDSRLITTSEGQSYAMFFALIANDEARFEQLYKWTEDNLSRGQLSQNLPAWLWGEAATDDWRIIDENPASDADLIIAYTLIQAGMLWNKPRYIATGELLADLILRNETKELGGVRVLLPAPYGFDSDTKLTLNPSYYAIPMIDFLYRHTKDTRWQDVYQGIVPVFEAHPQEYVSDWITLNTDWSLATEQQSAADYDAIRAYFWLALEAQRGGQHAHLVGQFDGIAKSIQSTGQVPEVVEWQTGDISGQANIGFHAILLPYIESTYPGGMRLQTARVLAVDPGEYSDNYYSLMLVLFGIGHKSCYEFKKDGSLVVNWDRDWCDVNSNN